MYTCTCLDATLHNAVCKRMHLLHMTVSQQDDRYGSVIKEYETSREDDKDYGNDNDDNGDSHVMMKMKIMILMMKMITTMNMIMRNNVKAQQVMKLMTHHFLILKDILLMC